MFILSSMRLSTCRGSAVKRQFAQPRGLGGRAAGWVLLKGGQRSGLNETAIELLAPRPSERVLEVGFGPGEAIRLLSPRISGPRVAGVDPSAVMLARARGRNRGAQVDLRLGDAGHLPWPDATFDAVLAINTAQLWVPLPSAVAEIRRVAVRGARVVLALHERCVSREGTAVCTRDLQPRLTDELTAAGFTVTTESRYGRYGTATYLTATLT